MYTNKSYFLQTKQIFAGSVNSFQFSLLGNKNSGAYGRSLKFKFMKLIYLLLWGDVNRAVEIVACQL